MSSQELELEDNSSELDTPSEYENLRTIPVFASHMSPEARPRDILEDFLAINLVSISSKDLRRVFQAFADVNPEELRSARAAHEWFSTFHTLIARAVRVIQDCDIHVLYDVFVGEELALDLLPIMLWAYLTPKEKNYIEPLLVKLYNGCLRNYSRAFARLPFGSND